MSWNLIPSHEVNARRPGFFLIQTDGRFTTHLAAEAASPDAFSAGPLSSKVRATDRNSAVDLKAAVANTAEDAEGIGAKEVCHAACSYD